MPYHITVVTKAELRQISGEKLSLLHPELSKVYAAGVGGSQPTGIYFVVIIWAAGQLFRKQLGLQPKQFHITLSAQDNHQMDKGIASLLPDQQIDSPPSDLLDHICFTLQAFHLYPEQQPYCLQLIESAPNAHHGFLRLADSAFCTESYKLAMLAYAIAFHRCDDEKLHGYCVKKLLACSVHTEWGHVFTGSEQSQLPLEIRSQLLAPWSTTLRMRISQLGNAPTLCLEPRHSLYIPTASQSFQKLPRFFRWLVPFQVAVMSTPQNEEHVAALASPPLGIRHVLTLTEETPLQPSWFRGKNIKNTFMPVTNTYPPSIEQIDLVMHLVQDSANLPLLIHCGGGKGRAGTVAACYLVAYGFNAPNPYQTQPTMSAEEAVSSLRAIRPGSIETDRQKAFVSKWASTIWKRQSVLPEVPSEPPPCDLEIEGNLQDGDLFMLVGLPGAGKSWFSRCLLARDLHRWTRISQDDSGSRASCENAIGHASGRVLLDRCNVSAEDRKLWLSLASSWSRTPICVWFDYEATLCVSRAQFRSDHPTLPPGNRVRSAVDQMRKQFSRPTLEEGFKVIAIVRSFSAAEDLVRRLSPSITIYKFPRTPHLLNLGAATSDDVYFDALPSAPSNARVVITEKVDGANLGFSLSSDRSKIIVQNRSHYVNSSTHEQFKKLGHWVEQHDTDLRHLLDRDPYFSERYLLFGEWMYATHSISYTHLPDRFIVFDLYDRTTNSFLDTKTLRSLVSHTSLFMVPTVYEGPMPSEAELREMVQRLSAFYDGRVEGVYLKIESSDKVLSRGKVVRADFIAGNEHWTKGGLRVNGMNTEASVMT
ncbi:hypothetical protein ONZ45_g11441 [Pleurotus djamor]|nr:hypothetical protein ONZ45_g11441 [Pleurotus djamor]